MTLQQKIDATKAEGLFTLEEHILSECEAWADWKKLTEKQKQDVISGYESCYFRGFEVAQKFFLPAGRVAE